MIGFIDWTENALHFYTFNKSNGRFTHESTRSIDIDNKVDTASLSGLSDSGLRHIYLSLPASLLSLRELEFPFSDERKIADTIAYELEGLLLSDTDSFSIDHIVTESGDDRSKVLAVCINKKELSEIIKTFSSAGLELKVITSLDLRLSEYPSLAEPQNDEQDIAKRAKAAGEELIDPTVDLRQGDLSFTGDIDLMKKAFRFTAIIVLIILLLAGVSSTIKYRSLQKENKALTGEVERAFRSAFPEDTRVVDVSRQFKGKVNLLQKKRKVLAGVAVLEILNSTTEVLDGVATLSEFKADGSNIILKGVVSSYKDVEALKESLILSFDNVNVTESESTSKKKIRFTIIMKEKQV